MRKPIISFLILILLSPSVVQAKGWSFKNYQPTQIAVPNLSTQTYTTTNGKVSNGGFGCPTSPSGQTLFSHDFESATTNDWHFTFFGHSVLWQSFSPFQDYVGSVPIMSLVNSNEAHTGSQALELENSTQLTTGFEDEVLSYLVQGNNWGPGSYRMSFWAKTDNSASTRLVLQQEYVGPNGQTQTSYKTKASVNNDWQCVTMDYIGPPVPSAMPLDHEVAIYFGDLNPGTKLYIDDFHITQK